MVAGLSSLYRKIHYIKVRYIEVWVYFIKHKPFYFWSVTYHTTYTCHAFCTQLNFCTLTCSCGLARFSGSVSLLEKWLNNMRWWQYMASENQKSLKISWVNGHLLCEKKKINIENIINLKKTRENAPTHKISLDWNILGINLL